MDSLSERYLLSPVEKCFDLALRKGKAVGETKPTESGFYLLSLFFSNKRPNQAGK